MYQESVNIIILSRTLALQTYLEAMLRNNHKDCEIKTVQNEYEQWSACDILLCELSFQKLKCYRERMTENGYIIYICNEEPCKDIYDIADEIIVGPSDLEYVGKRITYVYDSFKHRENEWLLNTCLNTLIDSMPDLVWFKDNDGAHVKVNKAFCHAVGKNREKIEGRDHCSVWDVDVDDCAKTEDIVRQRKKTCQFNELVKSLHGLRQFRTYKSPLFNKYGSIMGTVGIGHDITDLENMSTEMKILLNSMPYAIILKDQQDIVLDVNNKFEEYFEIFKDTIIGMRYDDWYGSLFKNKICVEKTSNGKTYICCSQSKRVLEISYEKIYDIFKSDVGELCIYRDTTDEYLLEQQLSSNSNTDYLTGLYNRRYFYLSFSKQRDFEQISILYVDLDYFKIINDTYGHQIGDEALKLSAKILQDMFPDDLIARVGGDEFLILKVGSMTEAELLKQGIGLICELKKNYDKNEYFQKLSASIGISYSTDRDIKIDELIKESDIALYRSKQMGRSRCCIYKEEKGESYE